jgi:hypothetical protein
MGIAVDDRYCFNVPTHCPSRATRHDGSRGHGDGRFARAVKELPRTRPRRGERPIVIDGAGMVTVVY